MPDAGHGEFVGERRLTADQIAKIKRWVSGGSLEGSREEPPPVPIFPTEWQLGPPDLLLQLPEPYELSASGRDVYRNFVVPISPGTNRFVWAFEFRPENPSVHHARILFDASGESRRRDTADPVCGFGGTMPPAQFPSGQLLGWAPGKQATIVPEGLAWSMDGLGDMVLQLHLQRTGKPEIVRPRVGFYLTNQPPAKTPVLLGLMAHTIDIPAGDTNYVVVRRVELSADAELLSVMPHAHYLARRVEFLATPPGLPPQSLLLIGDWQFNWQDQYRYAKAIRLKKGTQIEMRITYDNSAANPNNPHSPPRRVLHGPDSTDEMAELWLQLLPSDTAGANALRKLNRELTQREIVADFTERIKREPGNPAFELELGKALGSLGQQREAFEHLARAIEIKPELAEAHHYIGIIYFERRLLPAAREAFEQALALDPKLQRNRFALAMVAVAEGDLDEAEKHLEQAVELNPADSLARQRLEEVRRRRR
jgi:hypothetical protein